MDKRKFPGDSDCYQGLVIARYEEDTRSHVCEACKGHGCKPRGSTRSVKRRRAEMLAELSGSIILADQKGRAVFVDLEKGSAYVQEE